MKEKNYRTIWYSAILCVAVIFVHCVNWDIFQMGDLVYGKIQRFVADRIGSPLVSGFFLMSGYRMFQNMDWGKMKSKLLRRVRTVLLPYFLWNLVYFMYAYFMANSSLRRYADWQGVLKRDILRAFWDCDLYNPVFWFMKFLIIYLLLTPLIFLLAKKVWTYVGTLAVFFGVLVRLLIPTTLNVPDLVMILILWGIFYVTGAFLGMHPELLKKVEKNRILYFVVCGVGIVAGYIVFYVRAPFRFTVFFQVMYYLSLAALVWGLTGPIDGFINKKWASESLLKSNYGVWMTQTFFIYAFHWLFCRNANKLIYLLCDGNIIVGTIAYFLLPVIVISVTTLLYRCVSKLCPGLWILFSGNR